VDRIVAACLELASAFRSGATLFVLGTGQASADAQHVAVEFLHPVIVGKPSLPAVSLLTDASALAGTLSGTGDVDIFVHQLDVLARPGDVLLTLSPGAPDRPTAAALVATARLGLHSIAVVGNGATNAGMADHVIRCAGADGRLEKEARVTAYHLLWEITHVALEQQSGPGPTTASRPGATCVTCADEATQATVLDLRGDGLATVDVNGHRQVISVALVDAAPGATVLVHAGEAIALVDEKSSEGHITQDPSTDPMAALYPFLSGDDQRPSPVDRAADLRTSTLHKIEEATKLRIRCVRDEKQALRDCAAAIVMRVRAGGRLLIFGNGGSSTDAAALAELCLSPGDGHRPIPALALPMDIATVTALANDVGFSVVFSRQITSLGRANDIAVALSTSGSSDNLLRGLAAARSRGMLTVGFAGGDGGRMAVEQATDHLFLVPSASVHRIQEAQTTLYHRLWAAIQQNPENEERSRP
jgi:D-sedoheptulose 7-phosphate isomerase